MQITIFIYILLIMFDYQWCSSYDASLKKWNPVKYLFHTWFQTIIVFLKKHSDQQNIKIIFNAETLHSF